MTEKRTADNRIEKLLAWLVVLVLIAFFASFAVINFAGFERLAQTDMYEDTLVAKLMWENKTLFPKGYAFGNQFYVVATPVIAAIFYGICGSLNTGMALATSFMSLLIVLSFLWLLRPFVKDRLAVLSALLVLTACVFTPHIVTAERGQLFFIMCSYYACYVITLFFVLGDYIRARESNSLRPAALIISLLLSFATGMQSLRQTCIMTLPLIAFEVLMLLRARLETGSFFCDKERMPLIRTAAYFAANLLGLVFIKILNVPHQTIFTEPLYESRLLTLWKACRSIIGFDTVMVTGSPLFALMLAFYLLLLIAAAVIVLRRIKAAPSLLDCCWIFCVISIAAVMAASLLTSVTIRDIYLFIYFPLLALSFVVVYEKICAKLRIALVAALCLLSVINLHASYGEDLRYSVDDTPTEGQIICQLALDEGKEYVYGNLSYGAPKVAVWSDGKLIAGGWNDEVIFKVVPYINIQNIYRLEDFSKAIFVFSDYELELARIETEGNGAELTVLGKYGGLTVCTSSKQLLYPLTWDWQWKD